MIGPTSQQSQCEVSVSLKLQLMTLQRSIMTPLIHERRSHQLQLCFVSGASYPVSIFTDQTNIEILSYYIMADKQYNVHMSMFTCFHWHFIGIHG